MLFSEIWTSMIGEFGSVGSLGLQAESESGGRAPEGAELALPVFGLVLLRALLDIILAVLQHPIHQLGKLVRDRGDRFGRSDPAAHPSSEGPESRRRTQQAGCRHPQPGRDPVGPRSGLSALDLSSGDLVVGCQTQPIRKRLLVAEGTHVATELAGNGQRHTDTDPVDGCEVDPQHFVQPLSSVERRLIILVLALRRPLLQGPIAGAIGKATEIGVDRLIAFRDLGVVELVQFDGLPQGQEMLLAPIAHQGLGDLLVGVLAALVTPLREYGWIALTRQDRLADPDPGLADDVADDQRQLEVHHHQGLLHVLDVLRRIRDQGLALADEATQHHDVVLGTERLLQQPVAVQPLDPLAIVDICLGAAVDLGDGPSIDQIDSEAAPFQELVSGIQYTPVDSMATVSTPHAVNQSAIASRSTVKAPKGRTGWESRSRGTATQWTPS